MKDGSGLAGRVSQAAADRWQAELLAALGRLKLPETLGT
jgi:hypothetical protein